MQNVQIIPTSGDYDTDCAILTGFMKRFAELHEPDISIQNDGIGSYEFWGAPGYDRGTNYAEVENTGPYTFGISLVGVDEEYRENMTDDSFIGESLAVLNRRYECRGGDVDVSLGFKVTAMKVEQDMLLITTEWK